MSQCTILIEIYLYKMDTSLRQILTTLTKVSVLRAISVVWKTQLNVVLLFCNMVKYSKGLSYVLDPLFNTPKLNTAFSEIHPRSLNITKCHKKLNAIRINFFNMVPLVKRKKGNKYYMDFILFKRIWFFSQKILAWHCNIQCIV